MFCIYIYIYVCMYVHIMYMPGNLRDLKKASNPWNWNYRWLRVTICVLWTELGSSTRATSTLSHWAMVLALVLYSSAEDHAHNSLVYSMVTSTSMGSPASDSGLYQTWAHCFLVIFPEQSSDKYLHSVKLLWIIYRWPEIYEDIHSLYVHRICHFINKPWASLDSGNSKRLPNPLTYGYLRTVIVFMIEKHNRIY